MNSKPTAAAVDAIDIGGGLTVNRLGFGAMQLTSPGIWGDPPDRDRTKAAPRRAVSLDSMDRERASAQPGPRIEL